MALLPYETLKRAGLSQLSAHKAVQDYAYRAYSALPKQDFLAIWNGLARGLTGTALLAFAWMFFGVFLSLYGLLVEPWLAGQAPALIAAAAPLPAGIIIAFIIALAAECAGAVLLAIPFLQGRAQPRWAGYVLPAAALLTVVGDMFIAPGGPASNLATNLLSNLGPMLLLVVVGYLGYQMWSANA